MRYLFVFIFILLTAFVIKSQVNNEKYHSIGVSISNFEPGVAKLISKAAKKQTTYFSDVLAGPYALGLNYRNSKNNFINRSSFLFSLKSFIPKASRPKQMFEAAVLAGHEWHLKKHKWFYFGLDLFYGKQYYKYHTNPAIVNFDQAGVSGFSGLEFTLHKRISIRTEVDLSAYWWKRISEYKDPFIYLEEHITASALKFLSLELYFKL